MHQHTVVNETATHVDDVTTGTVECPLPAGIRRTDVATYRVRRTAVCSLLPHSQVVILAGDARPGYAVGGMEGGSVPNVLECKVSNMSAP